MRLLLIRHGQTGSNISLTLDTLVPGAPLTDLGHEQAAALAERLANETIDFLGASAAVRAQQTAAPLGAAKGLPVHVFPGAVEIQAGDLEMSSALEHRQLYVDTVLAWLDGDLDVRLPGGESGAEVMDRMDAVIASLPDVDTAALVSHGALIRLWAGLRARGVTANMMRVMDNAGVAVIVGAPGESWILESWEGEPVRG
jgi:broad specificity phosphatase PhoE